jgi:hypothetical protein
MSRPKQEERKVPEKFVALLSFKGRVVDMIYERIFKIEKEKGVYCSREWAIHSLLLELDNLKAPPQHLSHV